MTYNPSADAGNAQRSTEVSSQARMAVVVAPSDTVDLTTYAKALYIGSSGDIAVIPVNASSDTPVVFSNHPVGYMPVQVRRVMVTGTTAGSILALSA